jgi:Dienelactone hydrolase family
MAEVVLFHSVVGLRPGVIDAANRLRAAGRTVHTPDLFDGEVFDDLDDGMRKEDALGYREIARRAKETVAGLPEGLVYAGFSMGATYAELLAASRPGALGVVLLHGAESVGVLSGFFGVERWPPGVPVQVHYAAEDPWVEAEGGGLPRRRSQGGRGRLRGARLSRLGPPLRRPGPARVRSRLLRGDVAPGARLPGSDRRRRIGRRNRLGIEKRGYGAASRLFLAGRSRTRESLNRRER